MCKKKRVFSMRGSLIPFSEMTVGTGKSGSLCKRAGKPWGIKRRSARLATSPAVGPVRGCLISRNLQIENPSETSVRSAYNTPADSKLSGGGDTKAASSAPSLPLQSDRTDV